MRNEGLIKTYFAAGAIPAARIVMLGANASTVTLANSATAASIGVSGNVPADAAGEPLDVIMDGIAAVAAAGPITRGAAVTANATGQAVASTAGAGVRIIGFALEDAVAGDIIGVRLAPGFNNA